MTTDANSDASFAPLLVAAQALLSRTLGTDVTLMPSERLTDEERRNTVLRCRVTNGSAAHPSSIIIKQVVSQDYRPDATDSWDTQRFFRDWTGAEFLTTIAPDAAHCPRFYGGNAALGFFLLEDLGVRHSLVEPLLGADPASAEGALLAFASRLGQMHASAIGTAERFEQLASATNAALAVDVPTSCLRQANDLQTQATQLRTQIEQLGVPVARHFDDAIRVVVMTQSRDAVTIREAQVDDAEAIAHVRVSAWRVAYRGLMPYSYLAQANLKDREAEQLRGRLACIGDKAHVAA